MMRSLITAALVVYAVASHAQPSNGGPTPLEGAPLDGGISLLAASGVAYGLRHLRQRRAR